MNALPKYLINPDRCETRWMGDDWNLYIWTNRSWINSVWLGTVVNLLCVPQRVFHKIVVPLFLGDLAMAFKGLWSVPLITFALLVFGPLKQVRAIPYPRHVVGDAKILSETEAERAALAGIDVPLLEIDSLGRAGLPSELLQK